MTITTTSKDKIISSDISNMVTKLLLNKGKAKSELVRLGANFTNTSIDRVKSFNAGGATVLQEDDLKALASISITSAEATKAKSLIAHKFTREAMRQPSFSEFYGDIACSTAINLLWGLDASILLGLNANAEKVTGLSDVNLLDNATQVEATGDIVADLDGITINDPNNINNTVALSKQGFMAIGQARDKQGALLFPNARTKGADKKISLGINDGIVVDGLGYKNYVPSQRFVEKTTPTSSDVLAIVGPWEDIMVSWNSIDFQEYTNYYLEALASNDWVVLEHVLHFSVLIPDPKAFTVLKAKNAG